MRYAMLIKNKVIEIVKSENEPFFPPDQRGNEVIARPCEDEAVEAGMYYDPVEKRYYKW